ARRQALASHARDHDEPREPPRQLPVSPHPPLDDRQRRGNRRARAAVPGRLRGDPARRHATHVEPRLPVEPAGVHEPVGIASVRFTAAVRRTRGGTESRRTRKAAGRDARPAAFLFNSRRSPPPRRLCGEQQIRTQRARATNAAGTVYCPACAFISPCTRAFSSHGRRSTWLLVISATWPLRSSSAMRFGKTTIARNVS